MPLTAQGISTGACAPHVFNMTTEPIQDLNGFVIPKFIVGMAVGGSSAVNGKC
jgi:hypothetical protein